VSERMSGRSQEQALIGLLQQAPVLQRLAGRYLQVLRKIARPRTFGAGELVIAAGSTGPGLYILIKGRWSVGDPALSPTLLEPITTAGELAELTDTPQSEAVRSIDDSIALHIPHEVLATLFSRDADLHQRLSRNGILHLSQQLMAANTAFERTGAKCAQAEADLAAAESELNDARLLNSMRG
jgi:CRP-like cAMP-binding protein